MSCYQFNKTKILQKAKDKYCKETAAEYYLKNKEKLQGKSKNRHKNVPEEEKNKLKECQREKYQQLMQYKNLLLLNKTEKNC